MSNVVSIRRCGRCRGLGDKIDLALLEEVVAQVVACEVCTDLTLLELNACQPIFEAMVEAGVPRDLANEAMTFLLDRWTPEVER